jgi:hypothetical protein
MGLLDILTQVVNSGTVTDQHVDQVVQNAPTNVLAAGLASAFRSDQTPDIGQMVGQLFGNSNGQQQAGMLNQILATLGPAAAASLAGGVLGRVMSPGSSQITPAQASQLSPQDVQQVVEHAHQTNPGVVDELAGFYANHSGLIKTLGAAALAIAMAKMKDHVSQA